MRFALVATALVAGTTALAATHDANSHAIRNFGHNHGRRAAHRHLARLESERRDNVRRGPNGKKCRPKSKSGAAKGGAAKSSDSSASTSSAAASPSAQSYAPAASASAPAPSDQSKNWIGQDSGSGGNNTDTKEHHGKHGKWGQDGQAPSASASASGDAASASASASASGAESADWAKPSASGAAPSDAAAPSDDASVSASASASASASPSASASAESSVGNEFWASEPSSVAASSAAASSATASSADASPSPSSAAASSAAPSPSPTADKNSGGGGGGDLSWLNGAPTSPGASGGEASFYDIASGATYCGGHYSNDDAVVALSTDYWNQITGGGYSTGPPCGKKIKITWKGQTKEATVVDQCPVCPPGKIDLPQGFWASFTGGDTSLGILGLDDKPDGSNPAVSWEWA